MITKTINFLILFLLVLSNIQSQPIKEKEYKRLLKNAHFEKGVINKNGIDKEVEILRFKRKDRNKFYQYCIIKNNSDSVIVYTADQINYYSLKGEKYIRHRANGNYFFIHLKVSGNAELYERDYIPNDMRYLYYLKLKNKFEYYVFDSNMNVETVTVIEADRDNKEHYGGRFFYNSNQADQKFQMFINKVFGDCESVNKIMRLGANRISDISYIVETYNKCFN